MFIQKRFWFIALILIALIAILLTSNPIRTQAVSSETSPILLIDPGHGGADGGAVASDGTEEAPINLNIALKSAALADLFGIEYDMTREAAELDYPEDADTVSKMKIADQHQRMEQINHTPEAILISIHQNFFTSSATYGPQVFYGANPDSYVLATLLQENLTSQLAPDNRRLAVPINESVYLLRNALCPAVLIECGFLSNDGECAKLKTEEYRRQIAVVIIASYLQFTRGLEV